MTHLYWCFFVFCLSSRCCSQDKKGKKKRNGVSNFFFFCCLICQVFTLSALPLQRMPGSIKECFNVLKPGGLLLFRDYGNAPVKHSWKFNFLFDLYCFVYLFIVIIIFKCCTSDKSSVWWYPGLYDMTMLRFELEKRVGFREYMRSDGTRSYFFCLDTARDLFVGAGFIEVVIFLIKNWVGSSNFGNLKFLYVIMYFVSGLLLLFLGLLDNQALNRYELPNVPSVY